MEVEYYLYHFARLHTAKIKGVAAPHKAVLLLAVMQLISQGRIYSPEIVLCDELENAFKTIWNQRVSANSPFSCDICKPYFHLQHEPFWRLIGHDENYEEVAECLGLYANNQKHVAAKYTKKSLREQYRCAKIDNDLFEMIQNESKRKQLEAVLITKYLMF